MKREPEIMLEEIKAKIEWVLEHPYMSDWLKAALRDVDGIDPVALQNDVEILRMLSASLVDAQTALCTDKVTGVPRSAPACLRIKI